MFFKAGCYYLNEIFISLTIPIVRKSILFILFNNRFACFCHELSVKCKSDIFNIVLLLEESLQLN